MAQNTYNRIKLILKEFISARNPNKGLIQEFRAWLFGTKHRDEKLRAFRELMESSIYFEEKPGKDAFESYENVARRLGFRRRVNDKIIPEPRIRNYRKMVLRIAAILLPIIAISGITLYYWNTTKNVEPVIAFAEISVDVPEGETKHATLPDNSSVWINGNSELTYTDEFADGRTVNLKGEAYFTVQKEKERSFTVSSQGLKVTVLGTVFNMVTHPDGNITVVSLYEGLLRVDTPIDFYIIDTGKELEYDATTHKVIIREMARSKPEWMRRIIDFKHKPATDVLNSISKIYGYNIHIDNPAITKDIITLKFENEISFEDLLAIIAEMSGFTYKISGKDVYITDPR